MGRATHSSRGRPAGQANGASRLRRALDSPHSCRLAPSIRDAAEIPVQEISQPDARAPGLAEVQATSLEDRDVEHRDETAGVGPVHRAVHDVPVFAISLRSKFPVQVLIQHFMLFYCLKS